MSKYAGTKTEKNLMEAFSGESQARNKYTYYASAARKAGFVQMANIFEETANQEKEHALIFYNHLKECAGDTIHIDGGYPVDISANTLDLLKMAHHNEYEEFEDVYPSFAQVARDEGFTRVAQDFTNIAKIEKYHGDRFHSFGQLMEQNKLFSSDKTETWFCLNCGFIMEGTQAPNICPVCSKEQGYFIRLNMTPWTCQNECK